MKKYIYQTLFVLITLLSSCTEDFLDRSPSDQISSDKFFTQGKDLIYAVNACYSSIGFCDWETDYGYSTTLLRLETVTDNGYDGHSWNECYDLAIGTASAYDVYASYYWQERYRGIQRVNRVLEGEKGVTDLTDELKSRLLAEATFLRAYFYFDLVYLWGDVPYLTQSISPDDSKPDGNVPNEKVQRTDKTVILNALVTDLTSIAENLPENYTGADLGRVTKGAALSLKARILLYQEKWAEAAQAANEVMDLGVYTIYPSYEGLFSYAAINNSEVIFDLQEMPEKQWNFTLQNFGPNSVAGWSSGTPLQSLVDDYDCIDGLPITTSPLFDASTPYDNRDPRLTYTILYPGHEWLDGVYNTIPGAIYPGKKIVKGDDLTDGSSGQWNKTSTGYNWLKYMPVEDYYDGNMWNGSLHLILMRYAEVLLNYAEAKIEANDIDQSVYDAINDVRGRSDVNMPAISSGKSQAELRQIVRKERRVELAFEGLRLLDIRRWKIAEQVMPGVPKGLTYIDPKTGLPHTMAGIERYFNASKHYLWPIPQAEIDVSKIPQNPNW